MRISDWSSDVCSSDLLTRDPDQVAMRIERPRVIEALERLGVSRMLPTDGVAPMRAHVQKDANRPFAIAHQDGRTPANLAREVISRMRYFGFVSDVEPGDRKSTRLNSSP